MRVVELTIPACLKSRTAPFLTIQQVEEVVALTIPACLKSRTAPFLTTGPSMRVVASTVLASLDLPTVLFLTIQHLPSVGELLSHLLFTPSSIVLFIGIRPPKMVVESLLIKIDQKFPSSE